MRRLQPFTLVVIHRDVFGVLKVARHGVASHRAGELLASTFRRKLSTLIVPTTTTTQPQEGK